MFCEMIEYYAVNWCERYSVRYVSAKMREKNQQEIHASQKVKKAHLSTRCGLIVEYAVPLHPIPLTMAPSIEPATGQRAPRPAGMGLLGLVWRRCSFGGHLDLGLALLFAFRRFVLCVFELFWQALLCAVVLRLARTRGST